MQFSRFINVFCDVRTLQVLILIVYLPPIYRVSDLRADDLMCACVVEGIGTARLAVELK